MAIRRTLGGALLGASLLLTMTPAPSYALDPPRPLPGYRPEFVTERQAGPWEDCAWAAAAMLLDKWTNGATRVSRERLRALSGDVAGGSNFADIQRALARLGLDLHWSPGGGERVSWGELIRRLRHGSGAILLGDYAALPPRYGRWDPSLRRNTGVLDDHALYLDGYDPKTGRILVMDPLAPAGWRGEWVPVKVLKAFAWHTGNALWTATTPTAAPPPFAGVELGQPVASGDAGSVHVRWPIEKAPKGWLVPGFSAAVTAEAIDEPDPLADDVATLPAPPGSAPLADARTSGDSTGLEATLPVPTAPGLYRLTVALTDRRFGKQVATAGPFNLYVPGPRAWNLVMPEDRSVAPGGPMAVTIAVANVGTESWADPPAVAGAAPSLVPPRHTHVVGTWVGPAPMEDRQAASPTPPDVDFGPVPLEPGYVGFVDGVVQVPATPGPWQLVVRVVDDRDGPEAFVGSAPGVMQVNVGQSAASPILK